MRKASPIDAFLDQTLQRGGSDLHLAPDYPPMARVRGDLVALRDEALTAKDVEAMILDVLDDAQKAKLAAEHELRFTLSHAGGVRVRASCFQRHGGLGAAFRLVPARVLPLRELGCPEVLWSLAERRSGLVIVGGPSGAGKSTTLAALIDHVNKTRASHVVTIEEPVEHLHEPLRSQITQREVGADCASFEAGLRGARDADVDVVFVSELGSAEAIMLALDLATRGVLVFAAIEASGAAAIIERLLSACEPSDQARARSLLAEALGGVVTQHLLRAADGKGRVVVHEVLVGGPPAAAAVRESRTTQLVALMQASQAQGMVSLDDALERLMVAGRITPDAALDRSVDKEAFARAIAQPKPELPTPPAPPAP